MGNLDDAQMREIHRVASKVQTLGHQTGERLMKERSLELEVGGWVNYGGNVLYFEKISESLSDFFRPLLKNQLYKTNQFNLYFFFP